MSRKRYKICFIVTDALSFNFLYRDQLEFISKSSPVDLTLICGGDDEQIAKLRERNVGSVIKINLVRKPSLIKDTAALLKLLWFFIFNRFDLVVYSTPKALLLGSISSFLTAQPKRVCMIRGRVYENFKGLKRIVFSTLDKLSLLISQKVVFISDSLRCSYIDENIVNLKKAVVLGSGSSNGVDSEKFIPIHNDNVRFKVVVVGRICRDKGLDDLIRVVSKVSSPNVDFLIIGNTESTYDSDLLENLLYKFSNVTHYARSESVFSYFQNADLHLFLSHREGFGNVAIEAASCGVPTFAYDVMGVKDSVRNGVTGRRFEFGDVDAIAEAIDQAALSGNFRQNYPDARAWVLDNFRQEDVWSLYLNFYLTHIHDPEVIDKQGYRSK